MVVRVCEGKAGDDNSSTVELLMLGLLPMSLGLLLSPPLTKHRSSRVALKDEESEQVGVNFLSVVTPSVFSLALTT